MKDRGLIKWTPAFMMPEQIKLLKQVEIEDMKIKKPVLDEQEIQEINDLLVESILDHKPICIKLWLDGFIEELSPITITKIDPYNRKLYGLYKESTQSFSFDSLIGASKI
ncbi:YolD-like family protein [Pallidibacillus thermolactis]|jgi:YolD-like protein|uniref:YolD-like family protein n=1 Tax=Pallidibacillus thermolactis TaxID=251051 RepID=UPI0021D8361A|nr:YolD-like family protein [Pallidibacillus thermolactis]MCU9601753.1 YolD-like family protein [Pallidibacillus thermolactis subsp. kokeshiiformis]